MLVSPAQLDDTAMYRTYKLVACVHLLDLAIILVFQHARIALWVEFQECQRDRHDANLAKSTWAILVLFQMKALCVDLVRLDRTAVHRHGNAKLVLKVKLLVLCLIHAISVLLVKFRIVSMLHVLTVVLANIKTISRSRVGNVQVDVSQGLHQTSVRNALRAGSLIPIKVAVLPSTPRVWAVLLGNS